MKAPRATQHPKAKKKHSKSALEAKATSARARDALRESLSTAVAGVPSIAPNGEAHPPAPDGSAVASAPPQAVDLDATDDTDEELCGDECGVPNKINLLPKAILDNLGTVPILGALVVPVTQGVTLETVEGLPAVTFAVKPTKFTRGSGLVAISRF